mmetsp:Transcript_22412/g.29989  ORF Transcript_22412/g.29989 Transcript_22412/m.29989 type:complete len:141 (+) Transcript_22412:475-897(+)
MNFNSFSSGMVTLFHFMVVNNWFLTIDMYIAILGNSVMITSYFVSFWVSVVLILLNVVLSMVLEIYSSVEPEVQRNTEKTELIKTIKKIVEKIDPQKEAREQIGDEFKLLRDQLVYLETEIIGGGPDDDADDCSSRNILT